MPTAPDAAAYPVDALNRVKRCNDRAAYDHATVHALLDGGMLCHVAWVLDGQPLCTPTFYWRDGHTLYWHGSSASRMLRQLAQGQPGRGRLGGDRPDRRLTRRDRGRRTCACPPGPEPGHHRAPPVGL